MERAIDGGTLRDNLTDIYGDGNRLVYLKDVLDLIDEQPTITPPNEPLTQDELREMDGEPVFVKWTDNRILPRWYIVGCYEWNLMDFEEFEDYGKWLAYRRPPEGEAK